MKNSILLVFILSLLISCKSNTKSPVKDSIAVIQSVDQTQEIIKKFGPIIQGVWVKNDYVDKVIKTKSPLAAADEATGITTMYINTDHIMGDSLNVSVGAGNYEGSEIMLKFKPGKTKETILFGDFDLGYEFNKGDTGLVLYHRGKEKNIKPLTKYSKVLNKQPDDNLGFGMYCYINKGLVAGSYTLYDSTWTASKVSFNANGKVTGFLNFKTYNINIDINSDVRDNLDEIGFDVYSKDRKSYSFIITADTLKLYETKPNADSTLLVLDKLKYRLVRLK